MRPSIDASLGTAPGKSSPVALWSDGGQAQRYDSDGNRKFYADLVAFMSRGPVVALVLEGPEDTWEVVRTMMGATNPRSAAPGG